MSRTLKRHRLWNGNTKRGRDTRRSIRAFAKENGCPYPTLRRELRRGMEGKPFRDNIRRKYFYPEFGHCEMDILVSCVGGKGGLLVLTERKARTSIVSRPAPSPPCRPSSTPSPETTPSKDAPPMKRFALPPKPLVYFACNSPANLTVCPSNNA